MQYRGRYEGGSYRPVTSPTVLGPPRFAGLPVVSWAFAFRIWIAVVVALCAAFWLQLEAASSAATSVAILAAPTRGQVLQKASFRFLATVVGAAAAIALVGAFSQTRDLLLLAFATWVGLCVYAAVLADGNRAYAAVLSGYSVALMAIDQIDAPNTVFEASMARGAAITVGIVAIAVVNDLFAAPDKHHGLAQQLAALHRRARDYAHTIVHRQATDPAEAAALLRDIAALHPDITTLAPESSSGKMRTAAARSVAVALVAQIHAARTAQSRAFWQRDAQVLEGLEALEAGVWPKQSWRIPYYRSQRLAAHAGARAALWIGLSSVVFVLAGWPAAAASLGVVTVVVGLGAITPNPRRFTELAVFALPVAAGLVGVLEFLVLDGVTEFKLLALAIAPFMIGAALLTTLANPLLASVGRLLLIFTLVIFRPSNPQSYDPQSFLDTSLFACLGAALLLAAQLLIPPVSDERRRQWLMASARRELERGPSRLSRRYSSEEAMFRDAVRIGQITATGAPAPVLEEALSLFDRAGLNRLEEKA
jgi:uncharacterized membrane protein YccC